MKIMFLIRSLDYGGAERQLVELLIGLHEKGWDAGVVLLYPGGSLENELISREIPIKHLHKRSRWDLLFLVRLIKTIKIENPRIIHSYLTTQNILAVIMKFLFPKISIVWGIRSSNMYLEAYDWVSRLSYWMERKLSKYADLIIANSNAGKTHAINSGFPSEKIVVIQNGIDVNRFRPNQFYRKEVRNTWGVKDEICIGIIGRLDPMKDHETFFQAANILINKYKELRIICVGGGPSDFKRKIESVINKLQIEKNVIFLEMRPDINRIYNGLDILVSSSISEGFSNVVAEAMACGVPCVVTNVGDSAHIVGDTGFVVPVKSPEALAGACLELINLIRFNGINIRKNVRERIVTNFSTKILIEKTLLELRNL